MIPISSEVYDLITGPHYNIHTIIRAYRPGALEEDIVDLTDRLISGSISATIDDSARQIELTFSRGLGSESLSPLMAISDYNSPEPLLGTGGIIEIWIAITAPGVAPLEEDYIQIEMMRIDNWSSPDRTDEVVVGGRDYISARLLDQFIEQPTPYGPALAEEIMLEIIQQWFSPAHSGPVLPTGSSDFNINQYAQQEMSIMEALRTIGLERGWDVRSFPRFFSTADALDIAFYDPDRERTVPDAIIPLSTYTKLSQLESNDDDLRNVVQVWYDIDGAHLSVTSEDSDSIDQHGRRFMRIVEDASSHINTEIEAQQMADLALEDLKDPFASHGVETFLWPFVEINDLHQYPANDVHYDSDQKFAIVSYRHQFERHSGQTTLTTRGKPIAAYRRWRKGTPATLIVSTNDPPVDTVAKEGTLWIKVSSVAFPP